MSTAIIQRKLGRCLFSIFVMHFLIAVLSGCAGGDWNRAEKNNTADAYHEFLELHPNTSYSDEAKRRKAQLEEAEWIKAKSEDSYESYHHFYDLYQDSQYLGELKSRVRAYLIAYADRIAERSKVEVSHPKVGARIATLQIGGFCDTLAENFNNVGTLTFQQKKELERWSLSPGFQINDLRGHVVPDFTDPPRFEGTHHNDQSTCELKYISGSGVVVIENGSSLLVALVGIRAASIEDR